jgi:acyl carrier protein
MSRTESEITDAVFTALRRVAPDVDPTTLQPTENIRETLEIDSYDFLQFLIALDKQLGVEVPEADYGKLQTLADVTAYLRRRAGEAGTM